MSAALYLGDVETVLKATQPMADIVVTSPPYNLGKDYRVASDKKPYADYLTWVRNWGRALYAYGTHDDSHLFLNMGGSPSQPTIPFDVLRVMLDLGWILQNEFVWVKSISIDDDTRGHFKPINSPRFVSQTHEYIWHMTKDGNKEIDRLAVGVPYKDKSNIKRWKGKADLRCPGNSWFIPYPTSQETRKNKLHPATFPPELPRKCLALAGCNSDATVLDPFCGTGTTLMVAEQHFDANVVGIDLCGEFLETTANRLALDPQIIITI